MEIQMGADGQMTLLFENGTGTGRISAFEVFPGILLSYSDFQLEECESTYAQDQEMFGFEYCLEGKIEWEKQDGHSAFLGPSSFMPYDYERTSGRFCFPQHHYRGISFGIRLPQAAHALPDSIPVNLELLQNRMKSGINLDLSGNAQAAYVLGLVQLAQHQTPLHRKLACIELLLFLSGMEWTGNRANPLYLPRAQVLKLKQIVRLILSNLDHRYTLAELAERFQIPVTTLRRNFEGIYGCSVSEFGKKHRMEEAKRLLRETKMTTSEIAAALGYDNPSKFAAAFRTVVQLSPQTYRAQSGEQNGA